VLSFLRQAADFKSVRRNIIEKDFEEDPKADGDITGLLKMADKNLKAELVGIRDDLLKKARELEITDDKQKASETPHSFTRAFAEAFRAFKKAY